MGRWLRIGLVVVAVLALVVGGYTAYIGYEGSRLLVANEAERVDCRTPDARFGWAYEAINYDIADDGELASRNPDLTDCSYQGVKAGDEVVTDDGIRIAGWYIPAGNGADASAPTIVLVHGFMTNKSGILPYGVGLHDEYNLVAWDMRNVGRSTGDESTGGVLEQRDLRAVIDWLVRTKHPTHIGVLGNSLGAVTGLAEARDDARVEALVLDSMHTRIGHQIAARVEHGGYLSYFGTTLAIETGIGMRTGVDVSSVDAERTIAAY
ncbi:MAG TPA: alpha/beta fold hydrolase, partial [Candidatus Limnocylindria bacterium]